MFQGRIGKSPSMGSHKYNIRAFYIDAIQTDFRARDQKDSGPPKIFVLFVFTLKTVDDDPLYKYIVDTILS